MTPPVDRRTFLKLSAALLAAGGMPRFLARAAALADSDRRLVVLQLSGGNDGLNTLVPFGNDAYYAARPTIAIGKRDVIPLTRDLGMHPNLRALARFFDDGELAWFENVGYPGANRSHFASMAIWHSGDPEQGRRDGWIGRAVARYGDPLCATSLTGATPPALRSAGFVPPAIADVSSYRLELPTQLDSAFRQLLAAPRHGEAAAVGAGLQQMLRSSSQLQQRAAAYRPAARYPETRLGRSFRDAATLLTTGDDPRVLYLTHGGFDTHAGQRPQQDRLLLELAEALAAFQDDLRAHGLDERVLVLAFSEFGRRVQENGSAGTDHGAGGVMLALGRPVQGGIYGDSPDLEDLDNGDIRYRQDFRGIYGKVLDDWLAVPSSEVLGGSFAGPDFV